MVVVVYIRRFDWFHTSKGSRTLGGSFVNQINCYCPGGGGGNIPYILVYEGCYMLIYGCLWSSATDITEGPRAKIVNTPLTHNVKMG